MPNELTCPEAAEHLSAYLDDALPHPMRQGMRAHLDACGHCAQALDELACTRRLLRSLPREKMPDRMKSDLLGAIHRLRRPDRQ